MCPCSICAEQALDAVDDLESSAITEREDECEPVVARGLLDRLVQLSLAGRGQIG